MARHRGYTEIENPEAYAAAIKRSVHSRANAKRREAFAQAEPKLFEWLTWGDDYQSAAYVNGEFKQHPLGPAPSFTHKALEEWGAPHPNAIAKLQEIYNERVANNAKRAEQRAAEAASATAWTAGRQVVEGVVISIKSYPGFHRYSTDTYKWLVKRDDGSRIFASIPSAADLGVYDELKGKRVRFTVTVEPKAEEPTFAFGKRPAKAEIITPSQEETV